MLTLPSCVRRPCTHLYYEKERKSKPAKALIRSADVNEPLLIFTVNICLSVQSEMGSLKSVNSKQTSVISNKGVRVEGFDASCLRYAGLGNETWSGGILGRSASYFIFVLQCRPIRRKRPDVLGWKQHRFCSGIE